MIATPGTLRQFAAQADKDMGDYIAMSHAAHDPDRKRYFLRCAENRKDHARWYREYAERNEIETVFHEAAE